MLLSASVVSSVASQLKGKHYYTLHILSLSVCVYFQCFPAVQVHAGQVKLIQLKICVKRSRNKFVSMYLPCICTLGKSAEQEWVLKRKLV